MVDLSVSGSLKDLTLNVMFNPYGAENLEQVLDITQTVLSNRELLHENIVDLYKVYHALYRESPHLAFFQSGGVFWRAIVPLTVFHVARSMDVNGLNWLAKELEQYPREYLREGRT